jgi:glycosyltransferase involved in cell wall biosynthesis
LRVHLISVPNTIAAPWYSMCPFTAKVVKIARMLRAEGHHVIHYGHERSDVYCSEHVTVAADADLEASYPGHDPYLSGPPLLKITDPIFKTFLQNTIREIGSRKQPGDILLATFGSWFQVIAHAHPDLIIIEPGVGYKPRGPNCIFESYAIMHATQTHTMAEQPSNDFWYDTVIPVAYDPAEFTYRGEKENYMLFLGRMVPGKGIDIAERVAEETKTDLIVAGQGEPRPDTKYVKHVGVVDMHKRSKLLAGAKALICPSSYMEPFCGSHVEAEMCGTPVISTDWGAFAEYNPHGLTGYRCKSFEQFIWAVNHVHELDPFAIRSWAKNFSLDNIGPMYTDYFHIVKACYGGKGWFEPRPDRTTLRASSFHPIA